MNPRWMAGLVVLTALVCATGCQRLTTSKSLPAPVAAPSPPGPAAAPPSAPQGPVPFGINLTHLFDWTREWALVDVFKHSRAWIEKGPGPFQYTPEGSPLLKVGQSVETLMVRELEGHYPPGRYVATWKGKGAVDMSRFDVERVVKQEANRIECEVKPGDGGLLLTIRDNAHDDPVRDFRVTMPGFENSPQQFHPLFLERLAPFQVLRFMSWQQTINSPVERWDQRTRLDGPRWFGPAGAPIELMIDLANTLKADPWFCMPHKANDDYIRQFARLTRERLHPERKVYVEYSNEVWNFTFEETQYAEAKGKELGLGEAPFLKFYAQRSGEVFRIWEEVFQGRERLVRVLGSQAVNPGLSEQILRWKDAYKSADVLAVGPYFGNDLGLPRTAEAVAGMSVNQILDQVEIEIDGPHRQAMRDQAAIAKKYGLPMVAYEGGQHLAGVLGAENNPMLEAVFTAANRHPRMRDLTRKHLDHWFDAGGGLYVAFNYVSPPSKWGSWGLLEYQDQPLTRAPKYQAILDVQAARGGMRK